jgi:hypothetical protein
MSARASRHQGNYKEDSSSEDMEVVVEEEAEEIEWRAKVMEVGGDDDDEAGKCL